MTRVLLLLGILILLTGSASAGNLFGKVVEVNDGDTLTIYNLNRPVKVRLIGVDAPDEPQAFAQEAKRHLADLVLYRSVSIEYSGLVQNNYLLGKVSYREMDVGSQMLRDGVAWFDRGSGDRLSDADKQVYAECESAARAEHRGLWQDPAPVAPWKFKEQAKAAAVSQLNDTAKKPTVVRNAPRVLGSEDLLSGIAGSSVRRQNSTLNGTTDAQWQTLSPPNEHFSVLVPGMGYETSISFPAGTDVRTANYWMADYDGGSYLLIWSKGPNLAYTDEMAIEEIAKGVVSGLNRSVAQSGLDVSFESNVQKSLKVNNFSGRQFSLSAPGVPGVMRVFSKRVGDDREVYLLAVLRKTEQDPSADKFLKSLSLTK